MLSEEYNNRSQHTTPVVDSINNNIDNINNTYTLKDVVCRELTCDTNYRSDLSVIVQDSPNSITSASSYNSLSSLASSTDSIDNQKKIAISSISSSNNNKIRLSRQQRKKKLVRCGGILVNEELSHIVGVMNYESLEDKKWGLPKGHLKHGESIQQCAVREILEETGIRVKINEDTPFKKLNDTYYYIFVLKSNTTFNIRDHREIARVEWLPIDTLGTINMNRGMRKFYDRYDKIKLLIPSKEAYDR